MDISLQTGALPAYTPPAPTQTDREVRTAPQSQPQPQPQAKSVPDETPQASYDAHIAEQKRLETIQRAAESFKDVFPVSDTKFTIYKDGSGQYITRFTSLRDGKVTYYPEPEMLRLQHIGNSSAPVVKIDV